MEKNAGISLIVFTALIFFTMVMHPSGASFEHILTIIPLIVITHSVAIASIPFAAFGFWGISARLGHRHFLTIIACGFAALSLTAMLLAATANGLVLPLFVKHYRDAAPAVIESIQPVLKYNSTLNKAFDYIYTAGFCVAILCWSLTIIKTRALPRWLAWMGIAVVAGMILSFTAFTSPQQLAGLRIFITAIIVWLLAAAIQLIKKH